MTYLFTFLGLIAIFLNKGNKRAICVIYVCGMLSEELTSQVYHYFAILDDYWDFNYMTIGAIDLMTLAVMTRFYDRDFVMVFPLVFLMSVANVTIVIEWYLMSGTIFWDNTTNIIPTLSCLLLIILFGESDGCNRVIRHLRTKLLGRVFEYADNSVWIQPSTWDIQEMERGKRKCQ